MISTCEFVTTYILPCTVGELTLNVVIRDARNPFGLGWRILEPVTLVSWKLGIGQKAFTAMMTPSEGRYEYFPVTGSVNASTGPAICQKSMDSNHQSFPVDHHSIFDVLYFLVISIPYSPCM